MNTTQKVYTDDEIDAEVERLEKEADENTFSNAFYQETTVVSVKVFPGEVFVAEDNDGNRVTFWADRDQPRVYNFMTTRVRRWWVFPDPTYKIPEPEMAVLVRFKCELRVWGLSGTSGFLLDSIELGDPALEGMIF